MKEFLITIELDHFQTEALSRFLSRVTLHMIQLCADNGSEAQRMLEVLDVIRFEVMSQT